MCFNARKKVHNFGRVSERGAGQDMVGLGNRVAQVRGRGREGTPDSIHSFPFYLFFRNLHTLLIFSSFIVGFRVKDEFVRRREVEKEEEKEKGKGG